MSQLRIILYGVTVIIMILFLILINQKINFPASKITKYEIVALNSDHISISFNVDKPSTIYWRLLPSGSEDLLASDLTNLSSINSENILNYGGGVIEQTESSYTNSISNLSPNTMYNIYIIAVTKIGSFPKNVLKITFSTK
ncbi:MAG: hypothetical protein ACRCS8_03460 [Brevinema sp.]